MPNRQLLHVEYYCEDYSLAKGEKDRLTKLFIQLDDCICIMKIAKSLTNKRHELERIVQNKVINERGHLC